MKRVAEPVNLGKDALLFHNCDDDCVWAAHLGRSALSLLPGKFFDDSSSTRSQSSSSSISESV